MDDDDNIARLHPGARTRAGQPRLVSDAHGRIPAFVPTDEQRHTVMVLVANGIKETIIAQALRITYATLHKHFKREISYGREHIEARIGYAVVKEALAGNMAAARFWLTTHGGKQWQMPKEAYPDPVNPGDDSVVHFYMPPNRRDQPEEDEGPTIEGEAQVEEATGTDDA